MKLKVETRTQYQGTIMPTMSDHKRGVATNGSLVGAELVGALVSLVSGVELFVYLSRQRGG